MVPLYGTYCRTAVFLTENCVKRRINWKSAWSTKGSVLVLRTWIDFFFRSDVCWRSVALHNWCALQRLDAYHTRLCSGFFTQCSGTPIEHFFFIGETVVFNACQVNCLCLFRQICSHWGSSRSSACSRQPLESLAAPSAINSHSFFWASFCRLLLFLLGNLLLGNWFVCHGAQRKESVHEKWINVMVLAPWKEKDK